MHDDLDANLFAEPLPLNQLTQEHPGEMVVARCFKRVTERRDTQEVIAEYHRDKYAKLREQWLSGAVTSAWQVRMQEFGGQEAQRRWSFSKGENLFVAPIEQAQRYFDRLLADILQRYAIPGGTVVELGCGYGYNLSTLRQVLPDQRLAGGDLTESAIALGRALFANDQNLYLEVFDYCADHYDLLERHPGPLTIFTRHSIEQLPSARAMISGLRPFASQIHAVVHFEPLFGLFAPSLLGQSRRAHAKSVDYNRDLLDLLENSPDISLLDRQDDIFGFNPLNPTSLLVWNFRSH